MSEGWSPQSSLPPERLRMPGTPDDAPHHRTHPQAQLWGMQESLGPLRFGRFKRGTIHPPFLSLKSAPVLPDGFQPITTALDPSCLPALKPIGLTP